MKKVLTVLLCMLFAVTAFAACATTPEQPASQAPASQAPASAEAPASEAPSDNKPADGPIKVGFALRSMATSYYSAFADHMKRLCTDAGWELTLLDAADDIAKEADNMQTLIAKDVDLIFLDCVDPAAAVAHIQMATDAGIGVINLDSGVDPGTAQITTVYSNNEQNGRAVGLEYVKKFGKDFDIKAILVSGNKGSIAGEQRSTGLLCGIIEGRTGCTEEEAWEAAKTMYSDLVSKGKITNDDARFSIVGQGWGNWNVDGGLQAVEDILTANPDVNLIMGENCDMSLGGITAIEKANATPGKDIIVISAADGSKNCYDAVKAGKYFAVGENSPGKIAELGMQIAKEILVDKKDPSSYDEVTMTPAYCITAENVDEHYDYGF